MKRKSSKTTRGPSAIEIRFQGWLKHRPCCITGTEWVEVHHCKGSTFKHNKELIGHFFCLPLRKDIHDEYHAGTKAWINKYDKQHHYWALEADEYKMQDPINNIIPDAVAIAIEDSNE